MKRLGIDKPADIRRLQVKWQAEGAALLAAAQKRQEDAVRSHPVPSGYGLGIAAHLEESIRRALEGPATALLREWKMIEPALDPTRLVMQANLDPIRRIMQDIGKHERLVRQALEPSETIRRIMQDIGKHERLVRQALEPSETIRRLQESLDPWRRG